MAFGGGAFFSYKFGATVDKIVSKQNFILTIKLLKTSKRYPSEKFKMSDYPDLISYGYQIEAELGRNREGGRITWKAKAFGIASRSAIETATTVVIKQFCFAQASSSWSGYKVYSQELETLQKLNHHNIPQYLDSIETSDGFCLVQEYIEATPCGDFRPLSISEVKSIATQTLDILIYLQQQTPPILHRDLSTDNILLTDTLDVFLIDFGFSRLENQSVSGSSAFLGTPGFIAPEQVLQATTASDLYSLGVVLVCLLAREDIGEVLKFTVADDPYQLNLDWLLSDLELDFRTWLEKMTNAKVSQRFADAQLAKQALRELDSSLTWVESESESLTNNLEISSNIQPRIIGGIAITTVTTIATWGINFAASRAELTIVTVAIAVLATVAIAVTQLGAAEIAGSDSQAKIQGIALSTVVPILLVGASSLIWGGSEAVIICAAIAVAEVMLISYYWGLQTKNINRLTKTTIWLSAIAIGITFGLKLI